MIELIKGVDQKCFNDALKLAEVWRMPFGYCGVDQRHPASDRVGEAAVNLHLTTRAVYLACFLVNYRAET
jgi:hypothetical protein